MTPDLPIPEETATYDYPANARYAAESALVAAGLVDPDDGMVPRWRRGVPTPVWTNPMHVVDTVLAAALPHLRSLQVETQVRIGRELGRREAQEECAAMLEERAAQFRGMWGSTTSATLLGMAKTLRNIAPQPQNATSEPRTHLPVGPSHPQDSQAAREAL